VEWISVAVRKEEVLAGVGEFYCGSVGGTGGVENAARQDPPVVIAAEVDVASVVGKEGTGKRERRRSALIDPA